MQENSKNIFLFKKAYEISYALFRLASVVNRASFIDCLEKQGLSFLEMASLGNWPGVRISLKTIEQLLKFGADVNLINPVNADVVTNELNIFNSAIAEFQKSAKPPVINLDDIFSRTAESSAGISNTMGEGNSALAAGADSNYYRDTNKDRAVHEGNNNNGAGHSIIKVAMRQSAILERIRQNGNCRLKDVQEFLPEASERTLRYDLQNLIEQGLIERVGNGGPSTYYRTKEQGLISGPK